MSPLLVGWLVAENCPFVVFRDAIENARLKAEVDSGAGSMVGGGAIATELKLTAGIAFGGVALPAITAGSFASDV